MHLILFSQTGILLGPSGKPLVRTVNTGGYTGIQVIDTVETHQFTSLEATTFEMIGAPAGKRGLYSLDGQILTAPYDTVLILPSGDTLDMRLLSSTCVMFYINSDSITICDTSVLAGGSIDYPIEYIMSGGASSMTLTINTINVPVKLTNVGNNYFTTTATTGEVTMQGDSVQLPIGSYIVETSGTYSSVGLTDLMTFRLRKNNVDQNHSQSGLRGQIFRWIVTSDGDDWFSLWAENDTNDNNFTFVGYMISFREIQNVE